RRPPRRSPSRRPPRRPPTRRRPAHRYPGYRYPGYRSRVDEAAALEGPAEGDLVGVLEVTTHGQAGGEAGARDTHPAEHAGEVGGGGLPLDVRVGGEDDLLDLAVGEAGHELADPQVVRADAVDGVDGSAEHVVLPAELAGALDGDDVLGLLHHAEHG